MSTQLIKGRPVLIEDKLLIRRFNAGDMDALRRIYERYKPELLSVAKALVNDTAAVEDVLHDVFVRFASQAGRFQLKGSLKGYLAICVANRARNVNRMDRQNGRETSLEATVAPSGRSEPSHAADLAEQRQIMTCALTQLPQEQRQVVVLHVLSSLRFREIAQQTGESVNTIQSRYRYGLAKLQSLLNGEVNL
ncbi:MAG: sigma-70 family RNA polymerase sigma factor [Sedimentisphaerales bacterium]|nr:sigma-70 family RNA polymerase sigma factor [Sedimentisphaerales bacterium]